MLIVSKIKAMLVKMRLTMQNLKWIVVNFHQFPTTLFNHRKLPLNFVNFRQNQNSVNFCQRLTFNLFLF